MDHTQAGKQSARCRKVIGMRVRVDDVLNAQIVSGGKRQVTADLAEFRIDPGSNASVAVPDEIGLTASRCDLLKQYALR
jgi:hypothetical protein